MQIFNALLMEKRIIFLGYNRPAAEVRKQTHANTHTHTYTHTYTHRRTHTYIHTYTHIHTDARTHRHSAYTRFKIIDSSLTRPLFSVFVSPPTHLLPYATHTVAPTCLRTHTHTHIHTHTHTHTHHTHKQTHIYTKTYRCAHACYPPVCCSHHRYVGRYGAHSRTPTSPTSPSVM
jgi:hypothetical protein